MGHLTKSTDPFRSKPAAKDSGSRPNICERIFYIHYGGNLPIMNPTRARV
jgi:hypothetical protein